MRVNSRELDDLPPRRKGLAAQMQVQGTKSKWTINGCQEAVVWAVIAAPMLYVAVGARRPQGPFWPHIYDVAHVLLSLAATLVVLRVLRRILTGSTGGYYSRYWLAAMVGALVSGGVELLQIWGPGEASIADFLRDLAGLLGGLLLAFSYDARLRPRRSMRFRRLVRAAALAVVGAALAFTAQGVRRTFQRLDRLPMLCDFETPWDSELFDVDGFGKLTREASPSGFRNASGHVGKFVFALGETSEFEFRVLSSDWSNHQSLNFDIFSERSSPVTLELRVHDRHHKNRFTDRFNTTIQIAPGSATVSISMNDIEHGPVGRLMDMKAIHRVIIFMNKPSSSQTIYLDNLRLR